MGEIGHGKIREVVIATGQYRTGKVGSGEMRAFEVRANHQGLSKIGAVENHPCVDRIPEISANPRRIASQKQFMRPERLQDAVRLRFRIHASISMTTILRRVGIVEKDVYHPLCVAPVGSLPVHGGFFQTIPESSGFKLECG